MTIRYVVSAAVVAAMITVTGPVQAQAPTPSTAEQVKTWTLKKWNATKAEFAKDKAKWADCRKQGTDKKLKGKESWSFLYDCMKA
jgi:hypothetical protein